MKRIFKKKKIIWNHKKIDIKRKLMSTLCCLQMGLMSRWVQTTKMLQTRFILAWFWRKVSLSLSLCSQEARRHVLRWLPDVPVLPGGLHIQTRASGPLPGHESAAQPLLHLLFTQHLLTGGPATGTEQFGGLHSVRAIQTHTTSYTCHKVVN